MPVMNVKQWHWLPWLRDTSYPVLEFGWSNESTVFLSGGEAIAEVRMGESIEIPLKAIYVQIHRDDPKAVNLQMAVGDNFTPLRALDRFSKKELQQKVHDCESGGNYDRTLFFNTSSLAAFPDARDIQLNDREIRTVIMKITIPSDLPAELKRTIGIMPWGKVNPPAIGMSSKGVYIKIID